MAGTTTSKLSVETRKKLTGLAKFSAVFSDPQYEFGTWEEPSMGSDGVTKLGYFKLSESTEEFVETAYALGIIEQFNWPVWSASAEAKQLINVPQNIDHATPRQLFRLVTTYIRGDRFNEGMLNAGYEAGVLTAITKRALALCPPLPGR